MRALLVLSLAAAFALPTMGCIIVPRPHHHLRPHVVRPACPPGTHWDGYVCRPNHRHHHGRR